MKKKLCVIWMACCILMTGVLAGCGSSTGLTIDTGALAAELYEGITWQDQIQEVDLSKALSLYGISEDAVFTGSVYISTNATAEEIAVFEAVSGDEASAIKDKLETRVETQRSSFESYNPAEVPKLDNAVIQVKNTYVVLVVCDNTSEAKTILDNAWSGK